MVVLLWWLDAGCSVVVVESGLWLHGGGGNECSAFVVACGVVAVLIVLHFIAAFSGMFAGGFGGAGQFLTFFEMVVLLRCCDNHQATPPLVFGCKCRDNPTFLLKHPQLTQ